jgi:hypothetical protein
MRDWIEWFGWLLFLIAVVILFGWIVYLVGGNGDPPPEEGAAHLPKWVGQPPGDHPRRIRGIGIVNLGRRVTPWLGLGVAGGQHPVRGPARQGDELENHPPV